MLTPVPSLGKKVLGGCLRHLPSSIQVVSSFSICPSAQSWSSLSSATAIVSGGPLRVLTQNDILLSSGDSRRRWTMPAMVRLQAVRGYRGLVAELGGDSTRLLRTARIEVSAFDQPAAFIGFGAMIDLLERSARELDCPDFGFRLAER